RLARGGALRLPSPHIAARRAGDHDRLVPVDARRAGARMTELAGSRRLSPQPALAALRRGVAAVERIRPLYVVGVFIVVEWLVTLSLALKIRHKSWLWYQGGNQVWFYTTSWLLRHGQIPPTYVGYGWSVLLMPFTLFGGPNLINVLPAIIL